jgi:hypothetical protein
MSKTKLIVETRPFEKVSFEIAEVADHGLLPVTVITGSCGVREDLKRSTERLGWVKATRVVNQLLDEAFANATAYAKAKKAKKKAILVAPSFDYQIVDDDGRTKTMRVSPIMDAFVA